LPTYTIERGVFETFPAFRRFVVIGNGIDNHGSDPVITQLLAESVAGVNPVPTSMERERISAWNEAYLRLGVDPERYTPSARFLYQQIRKGKPVRSISKLVDVMNITSIQWCAPCGGDDLHSLDGGDLCLGFARGDETFAPLFKPGTMENPTAGEMIYYTPQSRRVMCRRWTWRNADFSKLTPETSAIAINIDIMLGAFQETDLPAVLKSVVLLLSRFCYGKIETHILSPTNTRIEIGPELAGVKTLEQKTFVAVS
jgi:DNA/RNA-binding domain of Phe-tRNA-synthetase-like protein